MAKSSREQLDGITLNVYLHIVRKRKALGPRDVMKAMDLSSPSVAYRHLQKLDDLGYLQKNEFGEYTIKNKAHIAGYVWVGRRLMPKMWIYSIVFLGILLFELYVLVEHLPYENYEFKDFFTIIMLITGAALAVFTFEGFLQIRRKPWQPTE